MASRASRGNRGHSRPPARRGGAAIRRALRIPPVVNGYSVEILGPNNGYSSRDRRPDVTVVGYASVATTLDLQVEWRTELAVYNSVTQIWSPAPTQTTTILGAVSGSPQVAEPPNDLTFTTWWYRVRAGNATTNIWGAWSGQQWLDVYPILGSTSKYIDANIGVLNPTTIVATVAYLDMNVGVEIKDPVPNVAAYLPMNVGVQDKLKLSAEYLTLNVYPPTGKYQAATYLDLNTVADQTPVPHIWWIRPEQGKEGYVFNIYGHGFGDFQNQYDGKVRIGNLVCSIARWEKIPEVLRPRELTVSGRPRTTVSTSAIPYVLLTSSTRVIQAGDIIEYDMRWDSPENTRLDIFPTFNVSGTISFIGYDQALLNDTLGRAWVSDQPEAYGSWFHRKFVVPVGHYLVGRTISNLGVGWYGANSAAPLCTASFRNFVVRDSSGAALFWATGDNDTTPPLLTYVANTGSLDSAVSVMAGHTIRHGQALDPDVMTPEHGWIVAIVPSGATSSMVGVSLEDD